MAVINVKIELHSEGLWNGRIYTSVIECTGLTAPLYTGLTFNVIWRLNAAKAAFRELLRITRFLYASRNEKSAG